MVFSVIHHFVKFRKSDIARTVSDAGVREKRHV